jgi:hypothetical protein
MAERDNIMPMAKNNAIAIFISCPPKEKVEAALVLYELGGA